MARRLRGWHRLGITLSVIWLVICTVYLALDLHSMSVQTVEAVYSARKDDIGVVGQSGRFTACELTGSGRPPADTESIELRVSCRPLLAPTAWLCGLPLALMWTVVPLTAFAFRWTVAGFRRSI